MTTKYASDVAQKLVDESLIDESQRQRAFEIIEEFWMDFAMDAWDYKTLAYEFISRGLPLSKEVARKIFAEMEKSSDGLSWDTFHDAIDKWIEGVDWSKMTNEELASFNDGTCAWAIVIKETAKAARTDSRSRQIRAKMEVSSLPSSLSLLEAVETVREIAEAKLPDNIDNRYIRLYAIYKDVVTVTDEIEDCQLIWDSRDCGYCGAKHDAPNFAYHVCSPRDVD